MTRDEHRLVRECKAARVGGWHLRAAMTLLNVNGIEGALEYVAGVQKRTYPQQMELPFDGDHSNKEVGR